MKKGVLIKLDKERTLRYGINALARIEESIGKPIMGLDLEHLGVKELLAIVHAGLYHEDNSLTVEQVGNLIDDYSDINEIAEKLGEALTAAFGKLDKKSNQGE